MLSTNDLLEVFLEYSYHHADQVSFRLELLEYEDNDGSLRNTTKLN